MRASHATQLADVRASHATQLADVNTSHEQELEGVLEIVATAENEIQDLQPADDPALVSDHSDPGDPL